MRPFFADGIFRATRYVLDIADIRCVIPLRFVRCRPRQPSAGSQEPLDRRQPLFSRARVMWVSPTCLCAGCRRPLASTSAFRPTPPRNDLAEGYNGPTCGRRSFASFGTVKSSLGPHDAGCTSQPSQRSWRRSVSAAPSQRCRRTHTWCARPLPPSTPSCLGPRRRTAAGG
jgi:hypothetical protein